MNETDITTNKIIENMLRVTFLKNITQLSKSWGIPYTTIDNWKRMGKIPTRRIDDFVKKFNIDKSLLYQTHDEIIPQNIHLKLFEDDMIKILVAKFKDIPWEDRIRVNNRLNRVLADYWEQKAKEDTN